MPNNAKFDVESAIPGMIVEIMVQAGDTVTVGQELLIIESMKMLSPITSEVAGQVAEICVELGDAVDGGQVLFRIELA